jgi:hypothetical protein
VKGGGKKHGNRAKRRTQRVNKVSWKNDRAISHERADRLTSDNLSSRFVHSIGRSFVQCFFRHTPIPPKVWGNGYPDGSWNLLVFAEEDHRLEIYGSVNPNSPPVGKRTGEQAATRAALSTWSA